MTDTPSPGSERDGQRLEPVSRWREFLAEVFTVVLGVILALAAQQGVDWLNWRSEVGDARLVISDELASVESAGIERVRGASCIERRLDELSAIVDQAARTGALPAVPEFGNTSLRIYSDTAWQTTMASQIATHFPAAERLLLAETYSQARKLSAYNDAEQLVWASLYAMAGPGRRLDPASEAVLRDALSQARYYNRVIALAGGQALQHVEELKLPRSRGAQAQIDEALHRDMHLAAVCEPLAGPAPAHYGKAQLSRVLDVVSDWQKQPPFAAQRK